MYRTKRSFMAFAVTKTQEYRAKYNRDPTMKELTEFAGPLWQQMNPEEQEQYRSDRRRTKKRSKLQDNDPPIPNSDLFKLTKADSDGLTHRTIIRPTVNMPFAQKRRELGSKIFAVLSITPRYAAGRHHTAPLEISCIVFSLEGGIQDADSWLLLEEIPDEQMTDAENRVEVNKVGLSPSQDAKNYRFTVEEVAAQLLEMTRDVAAPYWFVMGNFHANMIAQGTMNWMIDNLAAEGEAQYALFSPDRILCVNSLLEQLHAALSNNPHDSTRFPEWRRIVADTKAQIGNELFGLLLDVGGFERTEQHSITWTRPIQFPAAEETEAEFWEGLERDLEDLPITGEWEMFLRAEMEAKGIDPATVREYF